MDFDEIEEASGYEQGLAAEYARQETQALLDELERKKRARAVAVPTDDNKVKKRLREWGEPITLFGERAADRRGRVIQLLSRKGDDAFGGGGADAMDVDSEDSEEVRFCRFWLEFGLRRDSR
jgi:U4/U6 small nuclear ribonucleoprotein PRP4